MARFKFTGGLNKRDDNPHQCAIFISETIRRMSRPQLENVIMQLLDENTRIYEAALEVDRQLNTGDWIDMENLEGPLDEPQARDAIMAMLDYTLFDNINYMAHNLTPEYLPTPTFAATIAGLY